MPLLSWEQRGRLRPVTDVEPLVLGPVADHSDESPLGIILAGFDGRLRVPRPVGDLRLGELHNESVRRAPLALLSKARFSISPPRYGGGCYEPGGAPIQHEEEGGARLAEEQREAAGRDRPLQQLGSPNVARVRRALVVKQAVGLGQPLSNGTGGFTVDSRATGQTVYKAMPLFLVALHFKRRLLPVERDSSADGCRLRAGSSSGYSQHMRGRLTWQWGRLFGTPTPAPRGRCRCPGR